MNDRRGVLGLSVLVAVLAAVGGTSEGAPAPAQTPVPEPAASTRAGNARVGRETFTEYCSICHGVAAQGFIGPHIGGIDWTVPGLHAIVRGGVGGYGGMPAFNAEAVTDQNIADIAAYLASLAVVPSAQSATATATAATVAQVPATATPSATAAATLAPTAARETAAAADLSHGRQIYAADCAACHGASGQGGFGPSLRGEKARKDTAAAIAWIKNPKLPMPKLYPNPLSEKDVEEVAAYIESL